MTPITRTYALVIGAMFMGLVASVAQAAIVVQGTRVVFPEKNHEVTLKVSNTSTDPVVVQSWVDDGRANVLPEDLQVPFIVAPAVSRVDPGSTSVLRINATQPQLPADRESLFWLNVLETPPRSLTDETVLQFAFRTRIKLFFRPASLPSDAARAADSLTWKLIPQKEAKGAALSAIEVTNPTPYYVSFGRVEARFKQKSFPAGTGMVEPFGKARFVLSSLLPQTPSSAFVHYEVINDYGGRRVLEKPLSQ